MAVLLTVLSSLACRAQTFQWNRRDEQALTADRSLQKAGLERAELERLSTAIADQVRSHTADFDITSEAELRRVVLQARIAKADLNSDGTPEIIVQGIPQFCSPTGNCPLWVFQRMSDTYTLLLDGESAQSFTVQQTSTNGFRDIVGAMHGGAFDMELTLYRYQNGQYHDVGCYDVVWEGYVGLPKPAEPYILPCRPD